MEKENPNPKKLTLENLIRFSYLNPYPPPIEERDLSCVPLGFATKQNL